MPLSRRMSTLAAAKAACWLGGEDEGYGWDLPSFQHVPVTATLAAASVDILLDKGMRLHAATYFAAASAVHGELFSRMTACAGHQRQKKAAKAAYLRLLRVTNGEEEVPPHLLPTGYDLLILTLRNFSAQELLAYGLRASKSPDWEKFSEVGDVLEELHRRKQICVAEGRKDDFTKIQAAYDHLYSVDKQDCDKRRKLAYQAQAEARRIAFEDIIMAALTALPFLFQEGDNVESNWEANEGRDESLPVEAYISGMEVCLSPKESKAGSSYPAFGGAINSQKRTTVNETRGPSLLEGEVCRMHRRDHKDRRRRGGRSLVVVTGEELVDGMEMGAKEEVVGGVEPVVRGEEELPTPLSE